MVQFIQISCVNASDVKLYEVVYYNDSDSCTDSYPAMNSYTCNINQNFGLYVTVTCPVHTTASNSEFLKREFYNLVFSDYNVNNVQYSQVVSNHTDISSLLNTGKLIRKEIYNLRNSMNSVLNITANGYSPAVYNCYDSWLNTLAYGGGFCSDCYFPTFLYEQEPYVSRSETKLCGSVKVDGFLRNAVTYVFNTRYLSKSDVPVFFGAGSYNLSFNYNYTREAYTFIDVSCIPQGYRYKSSSLHKYRTPKSGQKSFLHKRMFNENKILHVNP